MKIFLWSLSVLLSLTLVVAITSHLYESYRTYKPNIQELIDLPAVNKYLDNHWKEIGLSKKPYYVVTGIAIDAIKWLDAQSFYVSGYVWQEYSQEALDSVQVGFVFPDAFEVQKYEAYRWKNGPTNILGWHFEGKINQNFDYRKYPFDHKEVKIRIWHRDFNGTAQLVPDLTGYEHTGYSDIFGLNPAIVLGGYDILDTFFQYDNFHYDTDMGLEHFSRKTLPELSYNLVLRRHVTDAIVIHIFPIVLVIVVCFLTLLAITFDDKKREAFNFHFLDVLTACAALFFVVILAHIHLREGFTGVEIMYFEYLYIITYACIIYVTINAYIVINSDLNTHHIYRIFKYHDNLMAKVLFIPFVLAAMTMIILVFF